VRAELPVDSEDLGLPHVRNAIAEKRLSRLAHAFRRDDLVFAAARKTASISLLKEASAGSDP
jgi:hypothetical protein